MLRRRLALAVGENAVFDGWTRAAVDSAAGQLGIDRDQARLIAAKLYRSIRMSVVGCPTTLPVKFAGSGCA